MIYASILFLIFALGTLTLQWGGLIDAGRKKRNYSCVPGITLLFSLMAWAFAYDTIGLWAFVPAIADPGSWVCLMAPFIFGYMWWNGEFKDKPREPSLSAKCGESDIPEDGPVIR